MQFFAWTELNKGEGTIGDYAECSQSEGKRQNSLKWDLKIYSNKEPKAA